MTKITYIVRRCLCRYRPTTWIAPAPPFYICAIQRPDGACTCIEAMKCSTPSVCPSVFLCLRVTRNQKFIGKIMPQCSRSWSSGALRIQFWEKGVIQGISDGTVERGSPLWPIR